MAEGTISPRAHITNQKIAFWCMIIYLNLFGNGFIMVAGMIPPPDPLMTGEQIKALFIRDKLNIQIGYLMMMSAIPFAYVFAAWLGRVIADIEGKMGVLALTTMLSQFSTFLLLGLSSLWWLVLAFRPETYTAENMLMFHDMVWLSFIVLVPPTLPMYVTMGIAAFQDRSPTPIFPRWYGWMCMWVTVLFLGGMGSEFFFDGPFAWDGIFALYLPFADFTVWVFTTLYFLWKYIKRQEAEL